MHGLPTINRLNRAEQAHVDKVMKEHSGSHVDPFVKVAADAIAAHNLSKTNAA